MFSFFLPPKFVAEYKERPAPFKNGLAEFVFERTYSRGGETWADVCCRVINGMYTIQKDFAYNTGTKWSDDKAMRSAMRAYDLLFNLKWSPPGRGLWMMGTPFIHERKNVEALNNCAFISSEYIKDEKGDFFRWFMEMLMLGVGAGFDTRGAGTIHIQPVNPVEVEWKVADSREGWALSMAGLVNSYLVGSYTVKFVYDDIRPYGTPIEGFGGTASGPAPLKQLHDDARKVLDANVGKPITSRTIVDICNMIGRCVVAGNVRRSAEIALGSPNDSDFVDLKDYKVNPERADYGWVSNNSVLAELGQDYRGLTERTWANGEPGYIWMDNVREYGRMNGEQDIRDHGAMGFNPCAEQPLWHREMCTLAEIYLPNIESTQELADSIKAAYLYAKSVTLMSVYIRDEQTRGVMTKNMRIGLSATGQTQFIGMHGMAKLKRWLEYGYGLTQYYDDKYSAWLGVNPAIRRTTVKPSGTVSLVASVTPGVHYPISPYYIRRVTLGADSHLSERMRSLGYPVDASAVDPNGSVIVSFPVFAGEGVRGESDVSVGEQLKLTAMNQEVWSDNGVSVTIKFDREKTKPVDLANHLYVYEHRLKAVSFLPTDHDYEQAPYEAITAETYTRMMAGIKQGIGHVDSAEQALDLYCDGEACEVPQ